MVQIARRRKQERWQLAHAPVPSTQLAPMLSLVPQTGTNGIDRDDSAEEGVGTRETDVKVSMSAQNGEHEKETRQNNSDHT